MKLGFDFIEECWDGVRLGEVCLEGEKAFGSPGVTSTARRNSNLVADAGELIGDGGTDPRASSENEYDRVRCHCAWTVFAGDGSEVLAWEKAKDRRGGWSWESSVMNTGCPLFIQSSELWTSPFRAPSSSAFQISTLGFETLPMDHLQYLSRLWHEQ